MDPLGPPLPNPAQYSVHETTTTQDGELEGKEETAMTTMKNRIHALYRVWIVQS